MRRAPRSRRSSRTTSRGRGSRATATYVFGVFLVAGGPSRARTRVYYQEIDFVVTRERARSPCAKTPPRRAAVRPELPRTRAADEPVGMIALPPRRRDRRALPRPDRRARRRDRRARGPRRDWRPAAIRARDLDLRHDLLHIRRMLAPTRDAVHKIVDDRIEHRRRRSSSRARSSSRSATRTTSCCARPRGSTRRATCSAACATTSRRRSRTTRTR